MGLPNGIYRTKNGSIMEISGQHSGISKVDFYWLEEGACCDCQVSAYEEDGDLIWWCDQCGGGRSELFHVTPNAEITGSALLRSPG